ncbi:hypothetical protein FNV43_RR18362 [Rhamnella rubrinervis]|uniref:Uncharacterized protein n=1 Tax=Rhamnella rubrinervis TaxID=2594499 RepID=A0A8K0E5P7_9ROSA|nr:hypothetical protein FNV43_RR18362 [Rhamnella rubrinervis]
MGEKEASCRDESVIIDIPEELEPDLNSTCWIHRVPRKLRQIHEAGYTPQLISVGPFHYDKPNLKAMEHHKTKYHRQFWNRDFCKHVGEDDIRDFIRKGDRRQRIWCCYASAFELRNNPDHFFHVVLRDTCFIFELFLRNFELSKCNDYMLRTPWLRKAIELDLIMLENQLPYFVFTELFDFILQKQPEDRVNLDIPPYLSKQQKESERHDFFIKITCEFFGDYYRYSKALDKKMQNKPLDKEMQRFKKIKHFTDLVRQFLCPNRSYPLDAGNISCLYTAKQLDRAGVSFVPCKNQRLADIHRKKGTCKFTCISWKSLKLEVPELKVEDDTECLMRNVMALEQCLYPLETYICNYISFLDQLINTAEDVELLVEKKVVHNLLGSNDAVADLVNKLCDQIVETSFYYTSICEDLNEHCNSFWNTTKATLKSVYFKDLWTGSSSVVAFFVLVFSIVSVAASVKDLFF